MIRLLRILGFMLIASGALLIGTWLVKPLRFVWPWLLSLPLPIRIGLAAAAAGFLLLLGSMIWERLEDRAKEKGLIDEP